MTTRRIGYIALSLGIPLALWLSIRPPFEGAEPAHYRAESSVFSEAILIKDETPAGISLHLVFPSGEASNPFDEGLAHYVEHLAWLGVFGKKDDDTDHHSNAQVNGFTTLYRLDTNRDDLPDSLRKLITVSLPLSVDVDFALQERNIILREYDLRVRERPLYPVYREMNLSLFGKGGLARSVIGEPLVIARYSLEDARSLHRQSHLLSSATLLAYGNVSEKRFEAALDGLSKEIEGQAFESPVPSSDVGKWVEDGSIEDSASLSLPDLAEDIFFHRRLIPLSDCEPIVRCEMIAQIAETSLSSTLPGGLAGPLRYDRFIARRFSLDIALIKDRYIHLGFRGRPDRGVSLESVRQVFESSLRATLENGLPQETLDAILLRLKNDLDGVLERDRPGYNHRLALGRLKVRKTIFSLSDQQKALEDIRLRDVDRFLKALSKPDRTIERSVFAQGSAGTEKDLSK